jgi:hypothetical protein
MIGYGLREQIEDHLKYNHYPPLPITLADACIEAIKLANTNEWERKIIYNINPELGVIASANVSQLIDVLRLDDFLE